MNLRPSIFKAIGLGVVLLAVIASYSIGASAQAISGNLVGTVLDSSSAVVTNATVAATKIDTGVTTTTTTNSTGAYHFENLPVGTYKITTTNRGFKTSI